MFTGLTTQKNRSSKLFFPLCKQWRTFLEHELASLSPHEIPMRLIETCYTSHHDLHMSSCCQVLSKTIRTPPCTPFVPLRIASVV